MPALTPEQEMLKQAALAATPGKWSWWTSNSYLRLSSERGGDGDILHGARLSDGCCTVTISEANRTFIGRANPAAISALFAQLEAVQAVPETIAGVDVARLVRNLEETSYNEGSIDLACRCSDSLAVIKALLAAKAAPGEPCQ